MVYILTYLEIFIGCGIFIFEVVFSLYKNICKCNRTNQYFAFRLLDCVSGIGNMFNLFTDSNKKKQNQQQRQHMNELNIQIFILTEVTLV